VPKAANGGGGEKVLCWVRGMVDPSSPENATVTVLGVRRNHAFIRHSKKSGPTEGHRTKCFTKGGELDGFQKFLATKKACWGGLGAVNHFMGVGLLISFKLSLGRISLFEGMRPRNDREKKPRRKFWLF